MRRKKKYFVSVAGNIGSGKSSLTRMIAQKLNWIPYFESVQSNPYLKDFYSDMKKWSFHLQVFFLSHRFMVHKKIIYSGRSVIQDRSIYEDVEIFARNLYRMGKMERRDYNNYRNLFKEMVHYLKPPDLIVYLKADVPTLLEQIRLRGRSFEKKIGRDYLTRLNRSYGQWISNYSLGEVIVVDTNGIDFVHKEKHFKEILRRIKLKLN